MSANRYLPAAENIANAFPGILAEQDLGSLISRFVLTETSQGDAWLFVVLDDSILAFIDSYASANVLEYISTALKGHLVMFSNYYGLRYAVRLNPSKDMTESL